MLISSPAKLKKKRIYVIPADQEPETQSYVLKYHAKKKSL